MQETITFKTDVTITDQDIEEILDCALETGINYWADSAQVVGTYAGKNIYEHFNNNGLVSIHLTEGSIVKEGPEWYELDRKKLVNGIKKYLEDPEKPYDILSHNYPDETGLDTSQIDAEVADMIIQYALFDEIVFA